MVTDGWYTSPGHRWGGLRQRNVSYQNYRKALPVFNHLEKGWAKSGCCRGMNTCLGTLMGPHGDRWLIGHLAADKVVPRPPPCPLASFVRWIVSAVNPFAIFLFNSKSAKLFQMLPALKRMKLERSTTSKIEEQTQTINLLFYFFILDHSRPRYELNWVYMDLIPRLHVS